MSHRQKKESRAIFHVVAFDLLVKMLQCRPGNYLLHSKGWKILQVQ